jgi:hypothetical protein
MGLWVEMGLWVVDVDVDVLVLVLVLLVDLARCK